MQKAFSLVELSIVLVILGLLTGGILAGQSLIRAAELRSITTDYNRYITAVQSFRGKYMALPGDMPNATLFWGARDGGDGVGADCFTVESTASTTCNGDGDGKIHIPTGGTGLYWGSGERYHAWVQLADAALAEGTYTGRTDSTTTEGARTPGKNVPRSKFNNNGWLLAYNDYVATTGDVTMFQGTGGKNLLSLVEQGQNYSSLNPENLWNIDVKLDDGKPNSGKIFTSKASSTISSGACSTADGSTAEYAVQNQTSKCWVIMQIE
jgi:prepilin-type N-terminal cleavage/methylation domain-containing protein